MVGVAVAGDVVVGVVVVVVEAVVDTRAGAVVVVVGAGAVVVVVGAGAVVVFAGAGAVVVIAGAGAVVVVVGAGAVAVVIAGEGVDVVVWSFFRTLKRPRRVEVVPSVHVITARMVCVPSASFAVSYARALPSAAVPARSKGGFLSVRTGGLSFHRGLSK